MEEKEKDEVKFRKRMLWLVVVMEVRGGGLWWLGLLKVVVEVGYGGESGGESLLGWWKVG
jgi:hypothetical protein